MAQQIPAAPSQPPFAFWPIRWLIAVVILVICILGAIGVVPGDKMMFLLVGALDLALFF